jgi:hypothetical protein
MRHVASSVTANDRSASEDTDPLAMTTGGSERAISVAQQVAARITKSGFARFAWRHSRNSRGTGID